MSDNKRKILLEVRVYGRIVFVDENLFGIIEFNGEEVDWLEPNSTAFQLSYCRLSYKSFLPISRKEMIYVSKEDEKRFCIVNLIHEQ